MKNKFSNKALRVIKRKQLFQSIIDNYYNGNISDYEEQLNKLNKLELIRFECWCRNFYKLVVWVDEERNTLRLID